MIDFSVPTDTATPGEIPLLLKGENPGASVLSLFLVVVGEGMHFKVTYVVSNTQFTRDYPPNELLQFDTRYRVRMRIVCSGALVSTSVCVFLSCEASVSAQLLHPLSY